MYHTKGIIVSLSELEDMLRKKGLPDLADDLDFETGEDGKLDLCFNDDDYLQKDESFNRAFYEEYGFAPTNTEVVSMNDELVHLYHIVKE